MTEDELDPREYAALIEKAESELTARNRARAAGLLHLNLTRTQDIEAIQKYLSEYDPQLMELVNDPEISGVLSDVILSIAPNIDYEKDPKNAGLLKDLKTLDLNYLDEHPDFAKIADAPVITKDLISHMRAKVLAMRSHGLVDPAEEATSEIGYALAFDYYLEGAQVPQSLRKYVTDKYREPLEVARFVKEPEEEIPEDQAQVAMEMYGEKIAQQRNERLRERDLFLSTVSDLKDLVNKILNAPEGKIPV